MTKLYMTKGLPGSGKSTWASNKAKSSNGGCIRITKDMLRVMLNGTPEGLGKREKRVLSARNALVEQFLGQKIEVIVDDTNFHPSHEITLKDLASKHDAEFIVQDFTHVSVEECIKRDLKRTNPVGEKVIRKMWQTYLYTPDRQTKNLNLPDTIIVDLDGTVALLNNRGPFEWSKVGLDLPNYDVIRVIKTIAATGMNVIYLSGRDSICRKDSQKWLDLHVGIPGELYMRPHKDVRKDAEIKNELYEKFIKDKFNVVGVFDDRDQVVALWRQLGFTCFQVNYGNF